MKKNLIIVDLIVIIAIALFIAGVFEFLIIEESKFTAYKQECWNDTEVWVMWNDKKTKDFGITREQMINITYAYLFNYSLYCPSHLQDCFIEILTKKCKNITLEHERIFINCKGDGINELQICERAIQVKDLTTEFLDDNCECVEGVWSVSSCIYKTPEYCNNYCIEQQEGLCYYKEDTPKECFECEKIIGIDCQKYKCGDYWIERK